MGTCVHKSCMDYVNKKCIELYTKANLIRPQKESPKRSARVSKGAYDSNIHCLCCGNEVVKSNISANCDNYSGVKTDSFRQSILSYSKQRNYDWAFTLQGYFGHCPLTSQSTFVSQKGQIKILGEYFPLLIPHTTSTSHTI